MVCREEENEADLQKLKGKEEVYESLEDRLNSQDPGYSKEDVVEELEGLCESEESEHGEKIRSKVFDGFSAAADIIVPGLISFGVGTAVEEEREGASGDVFPGSIEEAATDEKEGDVTERAYKHHTSRVAKGIKQIPSRVAGAVDELEESGNKLDGKKEALEEIKSCHESSKKDLEDQLEVLEGIDFKKEIMEEQLR